VDCIVAVDKLELTDPKYELKEKAVPKKVKTPLHDSSDDEEETPKVPSKKRPAEPSADQPVAKKAKTDNSTTTTTTTTTSSSTTISSGISNPGQVSITVPSAWIGVCSYGAGDDFPFQMHVTGVSGKQVSGTILWPSLNGATTKFRGQIEGNKFTFEEYEAITGEDDVQIPSNYEGTFSKESTKMTGKVVTHDGDGGDSDHDDDGATFNLALIKDDQADTDASDKPKDKTALSEGQKYQGTSFVEYPFTIKIVKRKGPLVEGTIKWALQKSKTKFKGKINNDELTFEEYEIAEKGEEEDGVKVPMLYSGKIETASISGTFGPTVSATKGKFTIKLQ